MEILKEFSVQVSPLYQIIRTVYGDQSSTVITIERNYVGVINSTSFNLFRGV